MELTKVEKLILFNQYEILSRLDPSQAPDYKLLRDCLADGYERDFEQLMPHFEPAQTAEVYEEVRQMLEMFRALTPDAGSGLPAQVRFAGFDGNEETEHYAYARFLLQERNLWKESFSNDLNTHSPVLPAYLSMLEVWKGSHDKRKLTASEVNAVVARAPHACRVGP